jgi:hypothetical protein
MFIFIGAGFLEWRNYNHSFLQLVQLALFALALVLLSIFSASLFIIRTGSLHKHMRLTEAEVHPKGTIKNKSWRITT